MKRILFCLLLLIILTGCTSLAPASYVSVTPHAGSDEQSGDYDAVTAESYVSLKNAILGFVREGRTEGTIHVTSYDGDVEADLAEAAYEVSKLDPLGAYAVDYMTHDCTLIVSYYEIRIHITFRRTAAEIAAIETIATQSQLESRLQKAVDTYSSRLTLRLSSYRDQDIPAMVQEYCEANPRTVMETPQITVSVYPDSGSVRIVEIDFLYTETPEALADKEQDVQESIDAAAEYIRYRQTDEDKCDLLFTYLTERFPYATGETVTPLYDALCGGVANPVGLAQAWQLICDQAGMECYTVTGMRSGESYTWNIVGIDGYYRHLDLTECILESGTLQLRTDQDMVNYYWNMDLYPACEPVSEPPLGEDQQEGTSPEETSPEETSPEETSPEGTEPPEGTESPEETEPPEEEQPPEEQPPEGEPDTTEDEEVPNPVP